jgi:Ca2+-binding RTX toxin-like protein
MGIILGTFGDDTLRGTDGIDVISGLAGNDTIFGGAGADVISGDDGNDILYANTAQNWSDGALNTVLGGAGDDVIYGGYGDILNGGLGFDTLNLDLSQSTNGVSVNFKPMTLLHLFDLVPLKIDNTQLMGFDAVGDIRGSAFNDRIVLANSSSVGSVVDLGAGNDFVRGNSGDDKLLGGDGNDILQGRGGHDILDGGAGDDRLSGGRLQDTLTGGTGADTFLFAKGDTAAARARADTITDFSHAEGDKISLRGMDAIDGGGHDAFTFIGSDKFSGTAGELRFAVIGHDTFVMGDTNGDGHADFTIHLDGQVELVKSDFLL